MSLADIVMEPAGQFAEELLGGTTLGALMLGAVAGPKAAAKLRKPGTVTAKQILKEAANKKSGFPSYGDWRKANPQGGQNLLDMSNLQPAIPGRPQLPVYVPPSGPSDRAVAAMTNPEVRETLKGLVSKGMDIMPEPWYRTKPLYDRLKKDLENRPLPEGKMLETAAEREAAAQDWYVRYMQHMAGASPGMNVPNNIRTGSYYHYLDKQGLPVPAKYVTKKNKDGQRVTKLKATPAAGYGAKTQGLHAANMLDIRAGGIDPIARPKNPRFAENLIGQERDVTQDTHNLRAIGMASKDPRWLLTRFEDEIPTPGGGKTKVIIKPREMYDRGQITMEEALQNPTWWEGVPTPREYGYLQSQQQGLANEMLPVSLAKLGRPLEPAEWQDKMWVGAGDVTGLDSPPEPFARTVLARVQYTAERMNMDPQEVLSRHLLGELPLLSIPLGAVVGGAALRNDQRSRNEQQKRF
jgi:hypothetical protein